MNTTVALQAGDYVHEFTPAFSWLVCVVLVMIPVIGYLIGKSETTICSIGKNEKGKSVFNVIHPNFAEHFAFATIAFFASTIVIVREHGNGIFQLLVNYSGSSTGELSIFVAMSFFIGVFSSIFAFVAYKAFELGMMRQLKIIEILAKRQNGIVRQKAFLTILKALKNDDKMVTTAEEQGAKQPSILPARR